MAHFDPQARRTQRAAERTSTTDAPIPPRALPAIACDGRPATLRCPRCGGADIHHMLITVYDRDEDEPRTRITTHQGGAISTALLRSCGSGNPSTRHHAVAISFSCGNCSSDYDLSGDFELTIAENNDRTEIAWRFLSEDRP